MGHDEKTADRVRRLLARHPGMSEKRMVGGLSFLVDGKMCCGVAGTSLMVRVGRDSIAAALARPHVQPMELGGRRLAAFVLVDPRGIRTEATLAAWIQRSLDFVATLPAKPARGVTARRER